MVGDNRKVDQWAINVVLVDRGKEECGGMRRKPSSNKNWHVHVKMAFETAGDNGGASWNLWQRTPMAAGATDTCQSSSNGLCPRCVKRPRRKLDLPRREFRLQTIHDDRASAAIRPIGDCGSVVASTRKQSARTPLIKSPTSIHCLIWKHIKVDAPTL